MIIAQFFFPSPLYFRICVLALRPLRRDWKSFIFSRDHDRKTEEVDQNMSLSPMPSLICAIGCNWVLSRGLYKYISYVGKYLRPRLKFLGGVGG